MGYFGCNAACNLQSKYKVKLKCDGVRVQYLPQNSSAKFKVAENGNMKKKDGWNFLLQYNYLLGSKNHYVFKVNIYIARRKDQMSTFIQQNPLNSASPTETS